MTNGFLILGICFTLLMGMTGAATCIYVIIYRRIVNKRVREVNSTGEVKKPPLAPIAVFVILLGALVLGFIIICLIVAVSWYSITDSGSGETEIKYYDMQPYADLVPAGVDDPLADITPEQEITGYTRKEIVDGDYRFVIYTNDQGLYNSFSELLIYTEYTGNDGDNLLYEVSALHDDASTESGSFGVLDSRRSSWFIAESDNFEGTVKLKISATDSTQIVDPEYTDVISTGEIEIDYAQFME